MTTLRSRRAGIGGSMRPVWRTWTSFVRRNWRSELIEPDVARLAEDHAHAARLAQVLAELRTVSLNPTDVETNIVIFDVGAEQLSILNAHMDWVVEPGPVDLLVGANSAETNMIEIGITE